jgi:GR25 family glycosyltransferase involved in LPS biosynthesis
MEWNTIFDHIYVLNLPESVDRKNHIIKEFQRVDIKEYEFFKATHYDSEEVRLLSESSFVKKFPTCFRCHNIRCSCENNFLTQFQLANWCSFINMFKDIIKHNYKFVLICEDDVVFSFQYKRIFNALLSKGNFDKYKINMNAPLLIRIGTAFNPMNHNSMDIPMFTHSFTTCNPCFAINCEMAKAYLDNLGIIHHTSDVYFHIDLPKRLRTIQSFTMYPLPVYELSFVKSIQKFDSLIRPVNALRRMEFKDFLFLTSNICIQMMIKNMCKISNIDVNVEKIGFHGNIDTFMLLNEGDKKKYYFQNKLLLQDDIYNDIKIIYYNVNYEAVKQNAKLNDGSEVGMIYNKYIIKINLLFDSHIELNKNDLESTVLFYLKYIEMMKRENSMILTIYDERLKQYFREDIVNKCIDEYNQYKKNIIEKSEIKNEDIDKIFKLFDV